MSGHVATTIMVAQINEGRKGWRIQKTATMRMPISKTLSVVRVMSREAGLSMILLFLSDFSICESILSQSWVDFKGKILTKLLQPMVCP